MEKVELHMLNKVSEQSLFFGDYFVLEHDHFVVECDYFVVE